MLAFLLHLFLTLHLYYNWVKISAQFLYPLLCSCRNEFYMENNHVNLLITMPTDLILPPTELMSFLILLLLSHYSILVSPSFISFSVAIGKLSLSKYINFLLKCTSKWTFYMSFWSVPFPLSSFPSIICLPSALLQRWVLVGQWPYPLADKIQRYDSAHWAGGLWGCPGICKIRPVLCGQWVPILPAVCQWIQV